MTSCAQSASASEVEDIKLLTGRLQPIVVANQIDLLDDEDQCEQVLNQMRLRLGMNSATLIGISARNALTGILGNDKQLLRQSGWPRFLDSLLSGFLPSRFGQRFAFVNGEVLRLLRQIRKVLSEALEELEQREAVGESLRAELAQKEAHIKAIEVDMEEWRPLERQIPEIPKIVMLKKAGWLTTPIAQCEEILSHFTFPANLHTIPVEDVQLWKKSIQSISDDLAKLTAELSGLINRSREIETLQRNQQEKEDSLKERQRILAEKHLIVQTLSFRYRKQLELEETVVQRSQMLVRNQAEAATLEAQLFTDRINHLSYEYVNFIFDGLSALQKAHQTAIKDRRETQERLTEAVRQSRLQYWARPTRLEFESKVALGLLEALARDVAAADHLFQPVEV